MTDNEPKGWEPNYREYFSANALDGGDIEHTGSMIAPSLAVEVSTEYIRDNFISKAEVRKVVEGMKISASGKHDPWSIEVAHIEAPQSYNTAFSDLLRALHISEE